MFITEHKNFKHLAEYLAIHYDTFRLARSSLEALGVSAPDDEALERLATLVAGTRSSLSMALAYLDTALDAGTLDKQFPEITELFGPF